MLDKYDAYDVDKTRDLQKNREVTLEDGSKMFVRQTDPHGFWSIHAGKGKVADSLRGSFTSFERAYNHLLAWTRTRLNKTPVKIEKGYVTVAGDNLTPLS